MTHAVAVFLSIETSAYEIDVRRVFGGVELKALIGRRLAEWGLKRQTRGRICAKRKQAGTIHARFAISRMCSMHTRAPQTLQRCSAQLPFPAAVAASCLHALANQGTLALAHGFLTQEIGPSLDGLSHRTTHDTTHYSLTPISLPSPVLFQESTEWNVLSPPPDAAPLQQPTTNPTTVHLLCILGLYTASSTSPTYG